MAGWQPYQAESKLAGKNVRVAGAASATLEAVNVFNGKPCQLPGGLLGKCTVHKDSVVKVSFLFAIGRNSDLWPRIKGIGSANAETLVCQIDPARLAAFEVEG